MQQGGRFVAFPADGQGLFRIDSTRDRKSDSRGSLEKVHGDKDAL
jgi:hypothetical protein